MHYRYEVDWITKHVVIYLAACVSVFAYALSVKRKKFLHTVVLLSFQWKLDGQPQDTDQTLPLDSAAVVEAGDLERGDIIITNYAQLTTGTASA